MTEQTPNPPESEEPATRSFPTEPASAPEGQQDESTVPGAGGPGPGPSPGAFGSTPGGRVAGPGGGPQEAGSPPEQPPYAERPPYSAPPQGMAPPPGPATYVGPPQGPPVAGTGSLPPAPGPGPQQPPYGEQREYPPGPSFGPPPQDPPHPPPYGQPPSAPPPRSPRTAALVAGAVVLALGGGAAGAGVMHALEGNGTKTVTSSLSGPPIRSTSDKPTGVAQVASAVRSSVVSIQVSQGEGSGIILSSDGEILTNNHVVESAATGGQIQVTFDDGKTAGADLVGRDPTSDLAVIKAKGVNNLKPAALGRSSDLHVGDQVVAIGSPLGLQGTVTSGIVSAVNRPVRTGDENGGQGQANNTAVLDAIQTDAAINPGNSGGALVNMSGQVIGINSAIASTGGDQMGGSQPGNIGVGFAIPIDEARPIAEQLEKNGKATHSQLGVQVQDSQSDTAGANLANVTGGGPADQAGLKSGDIVTKVDSRRVDSADALIAAVRSHAPGSKVQITYVRGGSEHTATVTLGTASS